MEFKSRYENAKSNLLNDEEINKENRDIFREFFEYQEYKLKRVNALSKLDNATYKTLYRYILMFKNVNKWFENKSLKKITKEDIKRVYDGLEDGDIKNYLGEPIKSREDYYNKIFRSKPFHLAGKDDLAREVIEYHRPNHKEVRFITEEDFKKIVDNAYKPLHRLLLWLAWDIGENINALLELKKSDFYKQNNPHTKEPEYRVNLRKDTLKRSRKARSEITNYSETVQLIDQILKDKLETDVLFDFDYRNAKKIIDRAVSRAKTKCIPNGEKVTWKDLRSGMACHLLKSGWNTDEVNARLGHRPSSDEIDKYVNFLAIDRHTPKKKIQQFEMEKLNEELNEMKRREKLQAQRFEDQQREMEDFKKKLALIERYEKVIKQKVK